MKPKGKKLARAALQRPCSKPRKVFGRPFAKGTSGNPSGKRKGSVSIAATLRRLLSKEDAQKIAFRLVSLAKAGDLGATKLLLDRIDGPQTGPIAVALAQSSAQAAGDEASFQAGGIAQVIIMDNGRDPVDAGAGAGLLVQRAAYRHPAVPEAAVEPEEPEENALPASVLS